MIREWKLIATPNEKNEKRQQLLLQCDMRDVFLVVKELGKICSRPEKSKGEYNFTIYLSEVNDEVESKLNAIARDQGIESLESSSRRQQPQQKEEDSMEVNPFLTQPGFPEMPNVKPVPVIDSNSLSSDMGMQLFPSAMNEFGSVNSLPGVSPENAASAVLPSGGMESVFVDTGDAPVVPPGVDPTYGMSTESQPIAPIPDFEKMKEETMRRQAAVPPAASQPGQPSYSVPPQNQAAYGQVPSSPYVQAPSDPYVQAPADPYVQAPAPAAPASRTARIIPSVNPALTQPPQVPQVNPSVTAGAPAAPAATPVPAVNAAPAAPAVPEKPSAPVKKEKKPLNPFGAAKKRGGFVPAAHIRKNKDLEKKEEKVEEVQTVEEAKPVIKAINLNTRWNIEMPLIPMENMNNMVSGSHNRFAHAAAMAVVETPGTIYNPLVIYGPASTGKTHFVNLIVEGISKSVGYENIFATTGIRFTKGVDLAIKSGSIQQLDELINKCKVIIIDDIHLMMLTAANKPYISKWLNAYVKENKQIVITTALPVHALASIEEALDFQLSQGWSVDLKQPSSQNYKNILTQLLGSMNVSLNEGEMGDFFINPKVPFTEVNSLLKDVLKLEKFIASEEATQTQGELMEMLIGLKETAPEMPTEDDLEKASRWKPSTQDLWLKWGIMYPKGHERNAYYAMYSLYQQAQQLGLEIEWQQVFLKDYDPGNITGSAFGMGDFVVTQNVNGIVVLGPQPATDAFDKEAEFKRYTLNILNNMSLKVGWVPYEKVKSPAACTRAIMDLM